MTAALLEPTAGLNRTPARISSANYAKNEAVINSAPVGQLRLTARGRKVVAVALMMAMTAIAAGLFLLSSILFAGNVAADTHAPTASLQTRSVVVKSGQSLWSIAQKVDPSADPRATMETIADLNGLDASATVVVGQVLLVPVVE
jgi:nucleoid-associated protein YgaU